MTGRGGPKSWTRARIYDLLAGVKESVPSLETDEITVKDRITDPSGETYSGAVDSLKGAGYLDGDFVTLFTAGGNSREATTSDTYSEVGIDHLRRQRPVLSELEPSDGRFAWALSIVSSDNGGDQIDVRLYDDANGNEIVEATAVDANDIPFLGPREYSANRVSVSVQVRNSDNATEVILLDACLHFGVII